MPEPLYNIIDFIVVNVADPNVANRNNTNWVLVADAYSDSSEPIYSLLDNIDNFPLITVRQHETRGIVPQLPAEDIESTFSFDIDIYTVESLILAGEEGSKLLSTIARNIINKFRDLWTSDAGLTFMYKYEVITNDFVGYDGETGLYTQRIKIETMAINI